jgi:hypothetical protein
MVSGYRIKTGAQNHTVSKHKTKLVSTGGLSKG